MKEKKEEKGAAVVGTVGGGSGRFPGPALGGCHHLGDN